MSRPSRWYIFSTTITSSSLSSPLSIIMIIIISLSLIQPSLTTHDTWLSRFINNLLWLDSSSNKLLIKLIAPVKVACQKDLNVCTLWGQSQTSLWWLRQGVSPEGRLDEAREDCPLEDQEYTHGGEVRWLWEGICLQEWGKKAHEDGTLEGYENWGAYRTENVLREVLLSHES